MFENWWWNLGFGDCLSAENFGHPMGHGGREVLPPKLLLRIEQTRWDEDAVIAVIVSRICLEDVACRGVISMVQPTQRQCYRHCDWPRRPRVIPRPVGTRFSADFFHAPLAAIVSGGQCGPKNAGKFIIPEIQLGKSTHVKATNYIVAKPFLLIIIVACCLLNHSCCLLLLLVAY